MKFNLVAVFLLPLVQQSLGQISSDEASKIAWRAYGDFVLKALTAGVPLKAGSDFVYVTPPTSAGIRAGTVVPEAVTNFDLYSYADVLQDADEPLYQGTGASYVQKLLEYLNSVELSVGNPTAAQKKQLKTLETAVLTTSDKFWAAQEKSWERWSSDPLAQSRGISFQAWTVRSDPLYIQRKKEWKTAAGRYATYFRNVYGTAADTLTTQINRITELAQDDFFPNPGYNMPTFFGQYTVQLKPWQQNEITDETKLVYQPFYGLSGIEEAADSWMNKTNQPRTTYKFSLKNFRSSDWRDLGHSSSVTQGSAGLFGIIGARGKSSSSTTYFNSWSSTFKDEVTLDFSVKGAPVAFNIRAGLWDVPTARATYPKIRADSQNALANKVRAQRLLLGYEPALTITFKSEHTWKQLYSFIEEAKRSAGGGISVFGFQFGASSGGSSSRSYNDLQLLNITQGGQIVIPPAPPGSTYILGVLGKKL